MLWLTRMLNRLIRRNRRPSTVVSLKASGTTPGAFLFERFELGIYI